ncbi:MAG: tetratricopeptide repeat-containing sensor histidine kinase [Puia sp.]|nr:tetratricopeptide repeat-containing sensor histidine kinase [Puia sp.]
MSLIKKDPARLCKRTFLFFLISAFCGLSSCHFPTRVNPDHPDYFRRIIDSAQGMYDLAHPHGGMHLVDSVYAIFPNPGVGDLYMKYSFKCDYYCKEQIRDYYKGLLYADSMIQVIHKAGLESRFNKEFADANFSKGDIYFKLGKYVEASKCYYNGKIFAEKTLNYCDRASIISRYAMVNYQQGKFLEAAAFFKESFDQASPCKTVNFEFVSKMQEQLGNTGLSYYKAGLADSAMKYYNRALDYIEKYKFLFSGNQAVYMETAKGVTYGNMGMVYYERGDLAMAETFLKKSIDIDTKDGNEKMDAEAMQTKLIQLYLETSRLPSAETCLHQLRMALDTLPNDIVEMHWRKLAWNYYTAVKQPEKANYYLQNYLVIKDSLDARARTLASINPLLEFQNLDQKYELSLLKKENELRDLYLLITIVFSFMALVIIFLVWRNWNRSKKNIRTLTSLNRQIGDQNLYLQTTLSSLEQSLEENAKLMKVVVHDLRNPIGAISSITSLMLAREDCPPEQRKMLKMIGESSNNSLTLINEMLEASTAPDEMKMEWVEMKGLLHYCVELLQFKAAEKKQQIVLQAEPLNIYSSRGKMWRVISNLIANSIKFSPEGATVTVRMERIDDTARISVHDQGIGIPDNLKDKIFELFTDAKRTGTSGERPFGMGLSISRKIVEAHGGRIWFESDHKLGTTFYVEFSLSDERAVA